MKFWEKALDKALWKLSHVIREHSDQGVRIITADAAAESQYLMRVYLTPRTWKWRCYLHYFFRGDEDRELHNHPWDKSLSLILTGGYIEERWIYDGATTGHIETREYKPFSVNRLQHDTFHRVDLRKKGCWTLFFTHKRVQDWGFLDTDNNRFIPQADYFQQRHER